MIVTRRAPPAEGPPLTTADVAEALGVHQKTVRRWLVSGRLRGFKVPGGSQQHWYISRAEIDRVRSGAATHGYDATPEP